MANWYGSARSNYFRVKDEAAFRALADRLQLGIWEEDGTIGKLFAIYPANENDGWPSSIRNEAANDWDETDVVDELAPHLADGQVAVLQCVGAEKLLYLTGQSIAFNSTGETVTVDINDIYAKAAEHFKVAPEAITHAES